MWDNMWGRIVNALEDIIERVAYLKVISIVTDIINPDAKKKKKRIKRLNQLLLYAERLSYYAIQAMLWFIGFSAVFVHLFKWWNGDGELYIHGRFHTKENNVRNMWERYKP